MKSSVLFTTYYVPAIAIVFIVLELIGLAVLIVIDVVLLRKLKEKDQLLNKYRQGQDTAGGKEGKETEKK